MGVSTYMRSFDFFLWCTLGRAITSTQQQPQQNPPNTTYVSSQGQKVAAMTVLALQYSGVRLIAIALIAILLY